jgi:hypothetical protein
VIDVGHVFAASDLQEPGGRFAVTHAGHDAPVERALKPGEDRMTLLDVELEAARHGFRLFRVENDTQGSVLQWQREADSTGPIFLNERAAFEWMTEQLRARGTNG